jgi:Tfp pilus assembly protein PilW
MDCKITSTKIVGQRRLSGSALVEAIMAIGITALLVLTLMTFLFFTGKSFAALFNYVDLDDVNRIAMDTLTRDVRQSNKVTASTTNSLTLEDSDGLPIVYNYSPTTKTLTRTKSGASKVILTECSRLNFNLGQRNTATGGYDVFPAATPATCKVVNIAWMCSRSIYGRAENTESVQTARIVIRKQGT